MRQCFWALVQCLSLGMLCHGLIISDIPSSLLTSKTSSFLVRRDIVRLAASSLAILAHSSSSLASSTEVDPALLQQCKNGALSSEQAIPGAYSQACMSIPIREIPVQGTTLRVEQQVAAAGSTGMAIWNSSLLLKRLLEQLALREPDWCKHKTVLELGCGTGLVSLTAAVLGADRVLATDGNPLVVELAQRNVEANKLSDKVLTQQLPWGLLDAMDLAGAADIVLGADLTYSPGSWRQLAESMEIVLADDGVAVYLSLGHSGFNVNAEMDGFLSVTQQLGLESLEPTNPDWPFPIISKSLSSILLETMNPSDRQVIQGTGGLRVVVLRKRIRRKRKG